MNTIGKVVLACTFSLGITACSSGSGGGDVVDASAVTSSSSSSSSSATSGGSAPNSGSSQNTQTTSPPAQITAPKPTAPPPPAPMEVTISWTPPAQRVDDSSLHATEISTYHIIYYLDDPNSTSERGQVIEISQTAAQSSGYKYTLSLAEGTYVFAIYCTDTDNMESDISEPASFTI